METDFYSSLLHLHHWSQNTARDQDCESLCIIIFHPFLFFFSWNCELLCAFLFIPFSA